MLCHLPSAMKGMGFKSPDWWAVIGCHACHDLLDGRRRVPDVSREDLLQAQLRALFLTWEEWVQSGLVQLPSSSSKSIFVPVERDSGGR